MSRRLVAIVGAAIAAATTEEDARRWMQVQQAVSARGWGRPVPRQDRGGARRKKIARRSGLRKGRV